MTSAGLALILVVVWTIYAYTAIPLPINDSLFSWVRRQWLSELTVLLACAGFLSVLWSGKRRANSVAHAPWWKAWVLWMAWSAISVFYSIDRGTSLRSLVAFTSYGLLAFVAGGLIQNPRDVKIWVRFLVGVSVVACIEGLFQYFGSFKDTLQLMDRLQASGQLDVHGWSVDVFHDFLIRKRIFSLFGWPNLFAGFLLLTLPMSLGLAYSEKRESRAAWLAVSGLLGTCLVLTLSMGAWIAAVISIIAIAWLARPNKRGANPLHFVAIAALLLAMIWVGSLIAARRARPYINSSTHSRAVYVQGSANIIRRYPLQGTGIGTFGISYRALMPREDSEGQHSAIHAHNTFLQVASELGLIGLALFVWMLRPMLAFVVSAAREMKRRPLLFGVASGVLAFFVHSVLEQTFYEGATAPFWWIAVGILTGGFSSQRANSNKATIRSPRIDLRMPALLFTAALSIVVFRLGMSDVCAAIGGLKGYLNEPRQAVAFFEQAQQWDPLSSKHPFEEGQRLLEESFSARNEEGRLDLLRQAKIQFMRAAKLSPWLGSGWLQLGIVQVKLGDSAEAVGSLAQASKMDPNSRAAARMLTTLQAMHGSPQALIAVARRWQRLEPSEPEGWFYEAQAWQKLGNFDNAVIAYRALLARQPMSYAAWFNLAGLLHQTGKDSESAKAYSSYLACSPMSDTGPRSTAQAFIVNAAAGN